MTKDTGDRSKAGRRLALVIAGTGVLYVLAYLLGREYGWSSEFMLYFDLAALAAFGAAIVMAIGLWRSRKD